MKQSAIEATLRSAWNANELASGRAVAFGVAPHDGGTFLVYCVPDDAHTEAQYRFAIGRAYNTLRHAGYVGEKYPMGSICDGVVIPGFLVMRQL